MQRMSACRKERDVSNVLDFRGTEILRVDLDDHSSSLTVVALLLLTSIAPSICQEHVRNDARERSGCVLYCYPNDLERFLDKLPNRVGLSSSKNEIIRCRLLEHAPHALDVVLG